MFENQEKLGLFEVLGCLGALLGISWSSLGLSLGSLGNLLCSLGPSEVSLRLVLVDFSIKDRSHVGSRGLAKHLNNEQQPFSSSCPSAPCIASTMDTAKRAMLERGSPIGSGPKGHWGKGKGYGKQKKSKAGNEQDTQSIAAEHVLKKGARQVAKLSPPLITSDKEVKKHYEASLKGCGNWRPPEDAIMLQDRKVRRDAVFDYSRGGRPSVSAQRKSAKGEKVHIVQHGWTSYPARPDAEPVGPHTHFQTQRGRMPTRRSRSGGMPRNGRDGERSCKDHIGCPKVALMVGRLNVDLPMNGGLLGKRSKATSA